MTTSREEALRRVRGGQGDLLYVDEAERAVSAWEASPDVTHEQEFGMATVLVSEYGVTVGRAAQMASRLERAARRARQEYGRQT